MSDLVEKTGLRIDKAMDDWKAANGGDDASCIDMPYEGVARAAISAVLEDMMEPSEAMVSAGDGADYNCSEGISLTALIGNEGVATVFKAMIAAYAKANGIEITGRAS